MTETSQPCVIFAGTSALARERLNEVAAQRGIQMRVLASVQDCSKILARKKVALLVAELDGNTDRELQLLAQLTHQHPQVSVLAIVERGDIPTTVQAIRAGAANCIEKPVAIEPLNAAVNELLNQIDARSSNYRASLTSMETTVLQHILQGKTNRQIGQSLHRSPRTIEVHRSRIMRKLGASTIVDLVRAASARGLA